MPTTQNSSPVALDERTKKGLKAVFEASMRTMRPLGIEKRLLKSAGVKRRNKNCAADFLWDPNTFVLLAGRVLPLPRWKGAGMKSCENSTFQKYPLYTAKAYAI